MTKATLRALGIITTVAGGLITILGALIEDKKMHNTIVEEVQKALANKK